MLVNGIDNRFIESTSPHSLGLRNNLTIPSPGFDQNSLIINEKNSIGRNQSNGFSGLTMDGTGLFGTGLFAGDMSTWTVEWFLLLGGVYMIYSMFYTTSNAIGYAKEIPKNRRKKKADHYRELARDAEKSRWF